MKIKIINDMEGKVSIKYAILVLLAGSILVLAGITNAAQSSPQIIPQPLCIPFN